MSRIHTYALIHVVFSTKQCAPLLKKNLRKSLYQAIWSWHQENNCTLLRIGGPDDHLHLLMRFPPELALGDYVQQLKAHASDWLQQEATLEDWPGWQAGYAALSVSPSEKERIVRYIQKQEAIHEKISFADEYRTMVEKAGQKYSKAYLV